MTFEEVLGHRDLKANLIHNIGSGRIPHAQLFIGKNGYGCLPMAIAYAHHLVAFKATSKQPIDPLNHPDIHFFYPVVKKNSASKTQISKDYIKEWRAFVKGFAYGKIEDWYTHIEAGDKQGVIAVDEAKEIVKTLSLKSYSGDQKVLIIWHAEKMNNACSNKLLKWFEEPNKKTSIILITEQSERLLQTIKSRCQKVNVPPLKAEDFFEWLSEKGIDPERAKEISKASEGDYNKLINLLSRGEQMLEFESLFIEWVRTAFKAKSDKKAINKLMSWSEKVSKMGRELEKQFLQYSLGFFRQAMLLNYGVSELVSLKIKDSSFSLENFSFYVDGENIEEIGQEIQKAIFHIERNGNGKIVLTDLSIKLTRLLHTKTQQ